MTSYLDREINNINYQKFYFLQKWRSFEGEGKGKQRPALYGIVTLLGSPKKSLGYHYTILKATLWGGNLKIAFEDFMSIERKRKE